MRSGFPSPRLEEATTADLVYAWRLDHVSWYPWKQKQKLREEERKKAREAGAVIPEELSVEELSPEELDEIAVPREAPRGERCVFCARALALFEGRGYTRASVVSTDFTDIDLLRLPGKWCCPPCGFLYKWGRGKGLGNSTCGWLALTENGKVEGGWAPSIWSKDAEDAWDWRWWEIADKGRPMVCLASLDVKHQQSRKHVLPRCRIVCDPRLWAMWQSNSGNITMWMEDVHRLRDALRDPRAEGRALPEKRQEVYRYLKSVQDEVLHSTLPDADYWLQQAFASEIWKRFKAVHVEAERKNAAS